MMVLPVEDPVAKDAGPDETLTAPEVEEPPLVSLLAEAEED